MISWDIQVSLTKNVVLFEFGSESSLNVIFLTLFLLPKLPVSISNNIVVLGAYGEDTKGSRCGAAYVFSSKNGKDWAQIAKLLPEDGYENDYFGYSVYVDAVDGTTVAVGAMGDDDHGSASGSVYIFDIDVDNGTWTQSKLTASDAKAEAKFGCSVSLKGDSLVVGTDDNAAYLFIRQEEGNFIEVQKIQNENDGSDFGITVAADRGAVAIGARKDYQGAGSAYIFAEPTIPVS